MTTSATTSRADATTNGALKQRLVYLGKDAGAGKAFTFFETFDAFDAHVEAAAIDPNHPPSYYVTAPVLKSLVYRVI
jgi:hypothetical protein